LCIACHGRRIKNKKVIVTDKTDSIPDESTKKRSSSVPPSRKLNTGNKSETTTLSLARRLFDPLTPNSPKTSQEQKLQLALSAADFDTRSQASTGASSGTETDSSGTDAEWTLDPEQDEMDEDGFWVADENGDEEWHSWDEYSQEGKWKWSRTTNKYYFKRWQLDEQGNPIEGTPEVDEADQYDPEEAMNIDDDPNEEDLWQQFRTEQTIQQQMASAWKNADPAIRNIKTIPLKAKSNDKPTHKENDYITITDKPTHINIKQWWKNMIREVIPQSGRPDEMRTFLEQVKHAKRIGDLENNGDYHLFSGKLATTLMKIIDYDLKADINLLEEEKAHAFPLFPALNGRQILFLILQRYQRTEYEDYITDICDLTNLTLRNDNLKGFQNAWKRCLMDMKDRQHLDRRILFTLYDRQVRRSTEFKPFYRQYQLSIVAGEKKRTYSELFALVETALKFRQREEQIEAHDKWGIGMAAMQPKRGDCRQFYYNGRCWNRYKCGLQHTNTITKGKGKGKGKRRKGKSKGRGKGRGRFRKGKGRGRSIWRKGKGKGKSFHKGKTYSKGPRSGKGKGMIGKGKGYKGKRKGKGKGKGKGKRRTIW